MKFAASLWSLPQNETGSERRESSNRLTRFSPAYGLFIGLLIFTRTSILHRFDAKIGSPKTGKLEPGFCPK